MIELLKFVGKRRAQPCCTITSRSVSTLVRSRVTHSRQAVWPTTSVATLVTQSESTEPFPSSSKTLWEQLSTTTQQLALTLTGENHNDNNNNNNNTHTFRRRRALAKSITLCESHHPTQRQQANLLLSYLLSHHTSRDRIRQSFRVGIAGAPGAGKSTLIEALGLSILDQTNDKNDNQQQQQQQQQQQHSTESNDTWFPSSLAVVCIDPSSLRTGGSLLGDKTRMTLLSRRHDGAYVRPAPSRGVWGGLAAYTHDVMTLCATLYPLVLLETVGIGQSELEVQECVDYLVVLVPPAAGDELQGVKKGIMEVADLIVVTKADGHTEAAARHTAADYRHATQFLHSLRETNDNCSSRPSVVLASAVTKRGLDDIWQHIAAARNNYTQTDSSSGPSYLARKRHEQRKYWMWKHLQSLVQERTLENERVHQTAVSLEQQLQSGQMTPRVAAQLLLDALLHETK